MTLDLKKQLNDLKNDPNSKSETARLRQIFAEVEATLSAGVSREKIVEILQQQGFSMGLKSFDSAMYRIRRQRKKQGVVTANADNLPALTRQLVIYTDEPATGEVLEGELVNQEKWEDDDELGDANEVVKKNMWVELNEIGDKVFNEMPKTRVLITREERMKRRNGE